MRTPANPSLRTVDLPVLRLLVALHETQRANMAWWGIRDLVKQSGLERDEVLGACERLIDAGLAETSGILMRAIMPAARAALSFQGERRRLSALATSTHSFA